MQTAPYYFHDFPERIDHSVCAVSKFLKINKTKNVGCVVQIKTYSFHRS